MYAEFFGLRELPFNNTPDPRFFFSTPDHEEALASLIYAVNELKGFVLLTGEVGAGKTLIARIMLRQFGTRIASANLNHAIGNARELMEAVCTEFDLPFERSSSTAHLVRILHDFLLTRFADNTPVVLVLDEAQNLPLDAFEQLRTIGNLEADDAKLLQVVIIGQPELQQTFREPSLRQIRQRIFRSFHLPALTRELTEGYIQHRLQVAGAEGPPPFEPAAIDRIFEYSQGLPRLINTLCDNALLSGYSLDQRTVTRDLIESVISQMMSIETGIDIGPAQSTWANQANPTPAAAPTAWMPPTAATPAPAVTPMAQANGALIEQLTARLAQLERQAAQAPTVPAVAASATDGADADELRRYIKEARLVYAQLQSVVDAARRVLPKLEPASEALGQREERVNKLAASVQTGLQETRQALRRVEERVTQNHTLERSAQRLFERIAEQSERTSRLAVTMRRIVDQTKQQQAAPAPAAAAPDPDELPHRMFRGGELPITRMRTPNRANRHANRVHQLLQEGRESLSSLRDLIGETRDYRLAAPAAPAKAPAIPSAARLAEQVQGLVTLVESNADTADLIDLG